MNQALKYFPNGFLHIREFATIAEAHLCASALAQIEVDAPDFRLVELSPTAAGAWICAISEKVKVDGFDSVAVDEKLMNAFLSLGPKPTATDVSIGILESTSIADIFKSANCYGELGYRLLEIRIKRAGGRGAFAFFALAKNDLKTEKNVSSLTRVPSHVTGLLSMVIVPLVGDYRRFF